MVCLSQVLTGEGADASLLRQLRVIAVEMAGYVGDPSLDRDVEIPDD